MRARVRERTIAPPMRLPDSRDASALASHVDSCAALVGLRIDPDLRAGVAEQLAVLADFMALLDGFPLAEDVEPGPAWEV